MHHYGEFINDNERTERAMIATDRNRSPVSSMSSLTQSTLNSSSSSPANLPLLLNSNEDEPLLAPPANTVNKTEAQTHQAQLNLVEIVNNLYSINSKRQNERDDEDEDTTDANESAKTHEANDGVDLNIQVHSMHQSACLMPVQAGLTAFVAIAPLPKLNKLNAGKSSSDSFGNDKKLKKLRPNLKGKDGLDDESGKGLQSADLLNRGNLFCFVFFICIKVHLKFRKINLK